MSDPTRDARRGVLDVLGSAVLFGTTGTTASFAPLSASAISIGAARQVIGGFGLILLLPWLGGDRRRVARSWGTVVGLLAGVATALYQLVFFAGVSLAGVALGTLVTIGSGPVFVGLMSWITLRERPTSTWWVSTCLCLAGLVLLTIDGSQQPSISIAGLVLSLIAGAAYAAYTVAGKRLIVDGATSAESMTTAFGLGAILLLPVLLLSGPAWMLEPVGAAVAIWLGLGATSLGYLLFGRGLRVLPAGPVATLVLAEPLVATILGIGVLGESIGPAGWVGAMLVGAGLLMQGRESAGPR